MSQPNLTVVVGKGKKRGKNKNDLTTNSFWSQINNPVIPPTPFQPPVRSLTEVTAITPKPQLVPPKPALVHLVDDGPHIPSFALNATNKNPPIYIQNKNATTIIAGNKKTGKFYAGHNKSIAIVAGNINPANKNPAVITPNIAQKEAANMGEMNTANQIAENNAGNPSNHATTNQPAIQPKPFTNQQEKKWQRFQAKLQKKYWNKKNAAAAGNQSTSSDNPQNDEAEASVPGNEAKPAPTPNINTQQQQQQQKPQQQKPPQQKQKQQQKKQQKQQQQQKQQPQQTKRMNAKSKRALQREMARLRLNLQNANPNAPGIAPGTNNTLQNEEANQSAPPNETIPGVQTPKPSPTGGPNKALLPTPQALLPTPVNQRSNAGSFFKPTQQQQMQQQQLQQQQKQQQQQQIPQQQEQQIPQQQQQILQQQQQPIPQQQQQQIPQQQQQQQKQMQQQKKQQQQKPKRSPKNKGGMADIFSYLKYPKGIPKSFLIQQNKSQEPGNEQMVDVSGPVWPTSTYTGYQNQPTPTLPQTPAMPTETVNPGQSPIFVETENQPDAPQPYSPSDIYAEYGQNPEPCEDSQSSDQAGQKRLSAFQRLGPVSQPKKPKLTINLTLNKEQPVREVVNDMDDDPERYTPVHLRKEIIMSTDETVMKYLTSWPWRKNVGIRKSATARNSRSVMILEQEQMEEVYEKDNFFIQITVKGYPVTWTKERVLDAVLESVKGYSLIPCFTEFYQHECKFLTLRSRSALIILHKTGFYIHKDGVELTITISQTDLSLNQIDFIPRIILRKRVAMAYMDKKLNLSAFTLQNDISHFIYFPLNRLSNQTEFIQLQSVIGWDHLTELDLSHNRLTNISGFELNTVTPRLKHLNLSFNYLEKITILLSLRDLPLKSIHLEGNPLCHDYIEAEHYVKVIRMMFPAIAEIDGVKLNRRGELPQLKQNYCPDEAKEVAEKFLDIYFPLLDSGSEHRPSIQGVYEDNATLTVTYAYKLRYGQIYKAFRNLFLYARFLDEGETDSVVGAMAITKLINRWPHTEHDPHTFTVDVLYHTETTTILRIGGILKLTAETSTEDEHLLSFTRTVVLYSEDGDEYKIQNEMVYWDEPTAAYARSAFRVNTESQKKLNLKIESTTDEDLRDKFLMIFMKLTTMDKKISERCLEINNWNLKLALEHFTTLLKSNNLDSLTKEVMVS